MVKKKTKKKAASSSQFRFERMKKGYKVYLRGKMLGEILPSREPTGRHCFYLGIDRRRSPRTYRGKIKAAEALESLDKLLTAAKKKKWKPEVLLINAWDERPTSSAQW